MISSEQIQKTQTYSKMEKMRQTFVVKKENRKMINDAITICRNIGFEKWKQSTSFTSWNINIVEELLTNNT